MFSQVSQLRLKGHRFPRSIISYAVWAYHRFALSLRDIEDLLAERSVIVSYESIRVWCQRFGTQIAAGIRRDRPAPVDKWHLDEVMILIRGKKHWLWRAVDANGDVLEILLQTRRNANAAKRFLKKLMKRWGVPRVLVTDKLRSHPGSLPKRGSPFAQGAKQPFGGVPSTHKTTRKDRGPLQISAPCAAISVRP